jgi:hypothetical protein
MTRPDEDLALGDHLAPDERDPEAPDSDAVEQATPANPVDQPVEVHRGLEVNEWDAVEQGVVVDLDDEY